MSIADKLLQINQVKQDIKAAIETKGVPMTNVAFTEYANKILEISGGGSGGGDFPTISYDKIEYFGWSYYMFSQSNVIEQLPQAWEHSLTVDPSEISVNSTSSNRRGTAQYPNGETEGVIIPQGVTRIGNYAFYTWWKNNQPLVIPNSVTSIGSYAFYNWKSNNHPLVIPNSVTSIAIYAFMDWSSNNQPLVIPNSVKSIGSHAFRNWSSNNHSLVIPNSVTSINSYAFGYWTSAKEFIMESETPPSISNNAFWETNNAPIYVPDNSVNNYKTATNWVSLASRIFPISSRK